MHVLYSVKKLSFKFDCLIENWAVDLNDERNFRCVEIAFDVRINQEYNLFLISLIFYDYFFKNHKINMIVIIFNR